MKTVKFTHKKRKLALEELEKMLYCGEKAGIRKAMFLGFGVMLGQIMLYDPKQKCGDFIPEDDDLDMCIDADQVTAEQEIQYFMELQRNGLFAGGRKKYAFKDAPDGFDSSRIFFDRGPLAPTGRKVRFTWISLKHKHGGVKSCNWFMFKWNGYYWHSKGGRWVTRRKFDNREFPYVPSDDAIMKGMPQHLLDGFAETNFHGVRVQFPAKIGTCADFWYPGWWLAKEGGASKKRVVCVVRDWKDEKTWKTVIA